MENWEENIFIYEQALGGEEAASDGSAVACERIDDVSASAWNGDMEIAGIEEFVGAGGQTIRTGIDSLDEDLGGGLPLGALVEVATTASSAGGQSFILHLLEAARREKRLAALVDGRDCFDPESTPSPLLKNLLWVRCDDALQAMKVADVLLRDENVGMVLLDLRWSENKELGRIRSADWYRLQRLAERSSACVCVCTPRVLIPSAQVRLELWGSISLGEADRSLKDIGSVLKVRALRLGKAQTSAFPRLIRRSATG